MARGRNHGEAFEMTDVPSLLRRAELDAEKITAIVRLVIFLSLALVIFSASDARGVGQGVEIVMALYGLGTAVGLVLAWRRILHPAIPYLFVTFDVILIAIQVLMLARLMGMRPASAFALPATALIFVILIHASMRYRPWLVVYAAVLFIASIELGPFLLAADPSRTMHGMSSMAHGGMTGLLNYQVLPLTLIALAAFILFVIGRRTRRLLMTSIQHVTRTARLSRYFSPNLAARLAEGDDDQLLAGRRQPAAVLFVDIRGFTALGETMPPDELGAFLSEYRNRLAEPVFSRGGTVDKFIGDAIMAVFGSPIHQPDDARRALLCALDILDAATRWSSEREGAGRPPVAIGIGAHYGEVFAGALGNAQLLEYTVIGDTVNIAERLEQLSREVGSPIVVSAALLQAAGDGGDSAKWRHLPPQQLKGHRQAVEVLCLAWGRHHQPPRQQPIVREGT
jgi:adenylate cyclase